jgi:transcriptional regulator with XRE-family HTH domain
MQIDELAKELAISEDLIRKLEMGQVERGQISAALLTQLAQTLSVDVITLRILSQLDHLTLEQDLESLYMEEAS